jgi:hypothetical protein
LREFKNQEILLLKENDELREQLLTEKQVLQNYENEIDIKRRHYIKTLHEESDILNKMTLQISLKEYESLFKEQISELEKYNRGIILDKLRR